MPGLGRGGPFLTVPAAVVTVSPGGTAATTVVLMRSPSVCAGCRIVDPGRLIIDDE